MYSHYPFARQHLDIVERSYLFITSGSQRVNKKSLVAFGKSPDSDFKGCSRKSDNSTHYVVVFKVLL